VVLRVFAEPPAHAPTIAIPSPATAIALTMGTLVTIVLGVFPQPILDLAEHAAKLRG
jgi:NADH-quinone oxidoreductase subunit N